MRWIIILNILYKIFLGLEIDIGSKAKYAGVSELADETDSKSVVSDGVWVRVPPPAPK